MSSGESSLSPRSTWGDCPPNLAIWTRWPEFRGLEHLPKSPLIHVQTGTNIQNEPTEGLNVKARLDRTIVLVVSLKNETWKTWLAPSQNKGAWAWPSALVSTEELLLLVWMWLWRDDALSLVSFLDQCFLQVCASNT